MNSDNENAIDGNYTFVVDASFNPSNQITGIGIIIHRSGVRRKAGPIIERISETHPDIAHNHGEAFAILRAAQIASGFDHVAGIRIKSDYNQLRRSLKKDWNEGGCRKCGPYYQDILETARRFGDVRFSFVPRRKNSAAHRLARIGACIIPQS